MSPLMRKGGIGHAVTGYCYCRWGWLFLCPAERNHGRWSVSEL